MRETSAGPRGDVEPAEKRPGQQDLVIRVRANRGKSIGVLKGNLIRVGKGKPALIVTRGAFTLIIERGGTEALAKARHCRRKLFYKNPRVNRSCEPRKRQAGFVAESTNGMEV